MGSVFELILERAVAGPRREEFARWLTGYHLAELNGFGDRLRYIDAHAGELQQSEAVAVRDACCKHAQALQMIGPSLGPYLSDWGAAGIEQPHDAFGLGFALVTLGLDFIEALETLPIEARAHAQHGASVALTCKS